VIYGVWSLDFLSIRFDTCCSLRRSVCRARFQGRAGSQAMAPTPSLSDIALLCCGWELCSSHPVNHERLEARRSIQCCLLHAWKLQPHVPGCLLCCLCLVLCTLLSLKLNGNYVLLDYILLFIFRCKHYA
jgi:hypothetical protein